MNRGYDLCAVNRRHAARLRRRKAHDFWRRHLPRLPRCDTQGFGDFVPVIRDVVGAFWNCGRVS